MLPYRQRRVQSKEQEWIGGSHRVIHTATHGSDKSLTSSVPSIRLKICGSSATATVPSVSNHTPFLASAAEEGEEGRGAVYGWQQLKTTDTPYTNLTLLGRSRSVTWL